MGDNVIIRDDEILGYSDDVIAYLKNWMKKAIDKNDYDEMALFEETCELLHDLESYDDDVVKCVCHAMGGWAVYKLVEDDK